MIPFFSFSWELIQGFSAPVPGQRASPFLRGNGNPSTSLSSLGVNPHAADTVASTYQPITLLY